MQLRRNMMGIIVSKSDGGSSDFYLKNRTYDSTKVDLDITPLAQDRAFTILCDWEVTAGYNAETYAISLDAFSCGETSGNFQKAIRIGNYSTYTMAYLMNKGPYKKTDSSLRSSVAIRYDPTQSKKLSGYLSGFSYVRDYDITLTTTSAKANIGGRNGQSYGSGDQAGIIHGLYIYNRSLSTTEMTNFVDNGIVP